MKKSKVLAVIAACGISAACGITGTMAWLSDSESITNTFAIGNIKMKLDEKSISPNASADTRTEEDQAGYKIVPGAVIDKDPTVTIEKGSEPCYVYVKVVNGLNAAVADAVSLNIDTGKWASVGENTGIYRYKGVDKGVVDATQGQKVLDAVFTQVKVDGKNVTEGNIEGLKDKQIKIYAYAHQANNISAEDVEKLAKDYFADKN